MPVGNETIGSVGCLIISLWNLFARVCHLDYKEFPKWWSIVRSTLAGNGWSSINAIPLLYSRYGYAPFSFSLPINKVNANLIKEAFDDHRGPLVMFGPKTNVSIGFDVVGRFKVKMFEPLEYFFKLPSFLSNASYELASMKLTVKLETEFPKRRWRTFPVVNSSLVNIDVMRYGELSIDVDSFVNVQSGDGHAVFSEYQSIFDFDIKPTVDPLDIQQESGIIHHTHSYFGYNFQSFYRLIKI